MAYAFYISFGNSEQPDAAIKIFVSVLKKLQKKLHAFVFNVPLYKSFSLTKIGINK